MIASVLVYSAIASTPDNTLTAMEAKQGWTLLYDGRTTEKWHKYGTQGPVGSAWKSTAGELVFTPRSGEGGDIMTGEDYTSFELKLDWNIAPRGNSGIFFHVDPTLDGAAHSGLEMQILDDAGHSDGRSTMTSAGSAYTMYPGVKAFIRPAGQWNSYRLKVNQGRVQHYANGTFVLEYQLGSTEWEARLAESWLRAFKDYGRKGTGRIVLQDHGDKVRFKNIKIRRL